MVGRIISVILTGLVVGSSVSILVQIFLFLVNYLSDLFRTDFGDLLNQDHFSTNELVIKIIFFFLIVPFVVGLIVGIIRNFTEGKRWHGPPDVILSVHKDDEELNVKSGFLTSIDDFIFLVWEFCWAIWTSCSIWNNWSEIKLFSWHQIIKFL